MAKKEVRLGSEEWVVVRNAMGSGGEADEDEANRRLRLWSFLDRQIDKCDGNELTIALTSPQRRRILAVMNRPAIPWRTDALRRVWKIKEAFGWTPPDLDDYDDDEEDE